MHFGFIDGTCFCPRFHWRSWDVFGTCFWWTALRWDMRNQRCWHEESTLFCSADPTICYACSELRRSSGFHCLCLLLISRISRGSLQSAWPAMSGPNEVCLASGVDPVGDLSLSVETRSLLELLEPRQVKSEDGLIHMMQEIETERRAASERHFPRISLIL